MAEENESTTVTTTEQQKQSDKNNDSISNNADNQNDGSSNDVELIDLSNDDEEVSKVGRESFNDGANSKDLMENGNGSSSNKAFYGNVDEDDDEDQDEDDDDEGDEDDDDDEEMMNVNGDSSSMNNSNNLQKQSNKIYDENDDEDEIMISDDDDDDEQDEDEESESEPGLIRMSNRTNMDGTSQSKSENSFTSNSTNFNCGKMNLIKSTTNQHCNKSNQQQINQKQQNNTNNKTTEEIIIEDDDDDDDEDEVQDLSTNKSTTKSIRQQQQDDERQRQNSIEDLLPKLSEELIGLPKFFQKVFTLGDCIAINKKSRSDIDIDKDSSILDCPSQVVPLIIKRSNKFPPKLKQDKEQQEQQLQQQSKQVNPPATPANQNTKNMLTISDFYSSSVGKFLISIGLSRVKQWYHKDAINKVRKQIRKEGEAEDLVEELKKQQEYLNSCRAANASYIFPTEKCEHCDFRSEFKLVLQNHMAYPHQTSRKEFKCNYCQFSSRDSKIIIDHVNFLHERKCVIELPPQLYECPICPYESGVKSKAATHIAKCLKFFMPEKLLVNKDDYFPTITPKPITQEDIKIYEATLQALRFAALNPQTKVPQLAGLPPGLQHQMYMVQQQQLTRIAPGRTKKQNFDQSTNKSLRPPPAAAAPNNPFVGLNQVNLKNVTTPQLYQMLSNAPASTAQFIQNHTAATGFSGLPQNALSLLNKSQMLAKMNLSAVTAGGSLPQPNRNNSVPMVQNNNKPNIISKQPNNLSVSNRVDVNPKGSFVMCEICDGYIKDLEQLRTHMHWIHKVRIHPKMLASRPPLNCQKCQWRFFTDQGLERHLLGAHGLVTSNMQEMVNQNQDGGRCTICGRVFTSKLVTHMNQAHKINLKPAHLSYKCTVCSATFNLYRLFENHVYMVHSGSVKRNNVQDESQNQGMPPRKKAALDLAAANGN